MAAHLSKKFLELVAEESSEHDRGEGAALSWDLGGIADCSQQDGHLLLHRQLLV